MFSLPSLFRAYLELPSKHIPIATPGILPCSLPCGPLSPHLEQMAALVPEGHQQE